MRSCYSEKCMYENDKLEYHCRYYPATFTDAERKWEINKKELLALYNAF